MTCAVKVVMLKICLLLFTNQILTLSEQTEFIEYINATVGENVLFSTNSTFAMNRSIEWKYNCEANEKSIAISTYVDRDLNIFNNYKDRVQFYDNGSFLLSNVELNDTGYYAVTLAETSGKEILIKKRLLVFEAEKREPRASYNGIAIAPNIGNKNWNIIGILIGFAVVGMCAICAVVIYFITRRKQESAEAEIPVVKNNENVNSNIPMVVYSTYVGTFPNYGKSCQSTPLDQT
ncbi:uncharacterized protein LOC119968836 [Scyliorhinus canicula]|uniref:uncharacterized protein LOC119968836 n=1 Tax=Scyliorhinus canicula TaxID=7830 RepID=UPI0018F4E524|nr:uncharacterized protein LOC119968836 [Scyliorhinus canicula]